jgi:hypothetical protein
VAGAQTVARHVVMTERRGQLVPIGIVALFAALPAWRFLGLASDDMFITYRYAQNLAAGHGLVFNPGERVFGVSDPGVAALLGAASWATGIAPHLLGTVLTWAAAAAIGAALVRAGAIGGRRAEGLAAALWISAAPFFWAAQGSGPVVALALVLWSALLLPARPLAAGALAGLAVWARPDAGLAVAILFLLDLAPLDPARRSLGRTARFAATAAAIVLAGAAAAWLAFGTLIPNAVAAKREFADAAPAFFTAREFWRRAYELFERTTGGFGWAVLAPALAGLALMIRRGGDALRLLALYSLACAALYTALDLPFFVWYAIPALVAVLAAWCLAAGASLRALLRVRAYAATALIALFALWCAGRAAAASVRSLRDAGSGDWHAWAYSDAGRWIRDHAKPGDDIAFHEVGHLAYWSRLPVRDLVGLVSPERRPWAAAGDLLGAFLVAPTEFVPFHTFDHRGGTRPIVARPWFPTAYTEAARFENERLGGAIVVYRRVAPAAIPGPRPPLRKSRPEMPKATDRPGASAAFASADSR